MPDRAEVDHSRADANLEGLIVELDGVESRVDGSVFMKASGEEAKDAGSSGFDGDTPVAQGRFGYLVADAVGPVGEVARFQAFGFFPSGPGPDVHGGGFDDILIDALAAQ